MQQPQLSFTDSIIARYGFPTNIQVSIKNLQTLLFTVPDSDKFDELLSNENLRSMVRLGFDMDAQYILVKRLDSRRSPLMIRTRSLMLLLERTS
jgi:hypothetical protein